MIQALKEQGIYNSTLFIVSAKHGQSPINPFKTTSQAISRIWLRPPDAGTNPGAIAIVNAAACGTGSCGFVQDDDIALIWAAGSEPDLGGRGLPERQRQCAFHR